MLRLLSVPRLSQRVSGATLLAIHRKFPHRIGHEHSNGLYDNQSHIIVLRSTRNECVR